MYCIVLAYVFFVFFFQAEDGIRDHCVTGVQTCALPICAEAECTLYPLVIKPAGWQHDQDNKNPETVPAAANGLGFSAAIVSYTRYAVLTQLLGWCCIIMRLASAADFCSRGFRHGY